MEILDKLMLLAVQDDLAAFKLAYTEVEREYQNPSSNDSSNNQLYYLLSEIYNQLLIRYKKETEVQNYILHKILELNYSFDHNGGDKSFEKNEISYDQRCDILNRTTELYLKNVNTETYDVSEWELRILRNISKNIHLLTEKQRNILCAQFKLQEFVFCLDIFVLIHQQIEEYKLFRLVINKKTIVSYVRKFYEFLESLSGAVRRLDSIKLFFYIVTKNGTDMKAFCQRILLYWRTQNPDYNVSTWRITREIYKIKNSFERDGKDDSLVSLMEAKLIPYLRSEIKSDVLKKLLRSIDNEPKKYIKMLLSFLEQTNSGNPQNELFRLVESMSERKIESHFDEMLFQLHWLVHNQNKFQNEDIQAVKEMRRDKANFEREKMPMRKFQRKMMQKFYEIKQWHSINTILHYINHVEGIDTNTMDKYVSSLAIQRTIHVIGEFIKVTKDTRNISRGLAEIINCLGPYHLNLTSRIRNQLSHEYSQIRVNLRKDINNNYLLHDLVVIKGLFTDLLKIANAKSIKTFLGSVLKTKSAQELQSLAEYVSIVDIDINELKNKPNTIISEIMNDLRYTVLPTLTKGNEQKPEYKEPLMKIHSKILGAIDRFKNALQLNLHTLSFAKIKSLLQQNSNHTYVTESVKCYLGNPIFLITRTNINYKIFYNNIVKYIWDALAFLPGRCPQLEAIRMKIVRDNSNLFAIENFQNILSSDTNVFAKFLIDDYIENMLRNVNVQSAELAKNPSYAEFHEQLRKSLYRSFENIFAVKEKYVAFSVFFNNLSVDCDDALICLQKGEEKDIQDYFNKKITNLRNKLLKDIPNLDDLEDVYKFFKRNPVYFFAFEMLLVDSLNILKNLNILSKNHFMLDELVPVLCGINLRNYLAHGSVAFVTISAMSSASFYKMIFQNGMELNRNLHRYGLFDFRASVGEMKVKPKAEAQIINNKQLAHECDYVANANASSTFSPLHSQTLHEAHSAGSVDIIRLCQRCSVINSKNREGDTALELATVNGFHVAIQDLLAHKADIRANKYKVILYALTNNDLEAIKCLISHCSNVNVKITKKYQRTLLHWAVVFGCSLKMIEFLIERCVCLTERDKNGNTVLHLAAMYGRHIIFRYLLENHMPNNIYDRNSTSNTPIHLACKYGHLRIVRLLSETETDIPVCLQMAVRNDHASIVKVLLRKSRENIQKNDLFDLAVENTNVNLLQLFLKRGYTIDYTSHEILHKSIVFSGREIFQFLLKNFIENDENFDMNCIENNTCKSSLLHHSVHQNDLEIVTTLIEHGADNSNNNRRQLFNRTVLHEVFQSPKCSYGILKYLIEIKSDVNAIDGKNYTPLHYAAELGKIQSMHLLLENGARVDASQCGTTPLHLACKMGHADCVRLLMKYGATQFLTRQNSVSQTPIDCASHFPDLVQWLQEYI